MFSLNQYFILCNTIFYIVEGYNASANVAEINVNEHNSNALTKQVPEMNVTYNNYNMPLTPIFNEYGYPYRKTKKNHKMNVTKYGYRNAIPELGIHLKVYSYNITTDTPLINEVPIINITEFDYRTATQLPGVDAKTYLKQLSKLIGTKTEFIPLTKHTKINVRDFNYDGNEQVLDTNKNGDIPKIPKKHPDINVIDEAYNIKRILETNGTDVDYGALTEHLETNKTAEDAEVNETELYRAQSKVPEVNGVKDTRAHLKYKRVIDICKHRDDVCKSNDRNVCSLRYLHNKEEYKDFLNTCYLFLSNMCDYPGEEFNIVDGGTCKEYLNSRRSKENPSDSIFNMRKMLKNGTKNVNDTKSVTPHLRNAVPTFSKLYDIDTAFDYHICPSSCPDVYSPVCFNVNRNHGMHFKYFTFINHCSGDMYYCKHWEEFLPPPGMDEMVRQSGLGWTFCGSNRYIQFHRFSEAASSMGHYGWLAGDYRFSHIMEPHQRIPGFG